VSLASEFAPRLFPACRPTELTGWGGSSLDECGDETCLQEQLHATAVWWFSRPATSSPFDSFRKRQRTVLMSNCHFLASYKLLELAGTARTIWAPDRTGCWCRTRCNCETVCVLTNALRFGNSNGGPLHSCYKNLSCRHARKNARFCIRRPVSFRHWMFLGRVQNHPTQAREQAAF